MYEYIAESIQIPFRETFRVPLLSLPVSFRDSVFLITFPIFRRFPEESAQSTLCSTQLRNQGFWPVGCQQRLFHFSLPETLPVPSGKLPGCNVLHPTENLPVFLLEALPGPSGYIPGCSIFKTHYCSKTKVNKSFPKDHTDMLWRFCCNLPYS